MRCSIYLCTNKINGKVYVGQTWNTIEHRFNQHIDDKRMYYFHSALKKYGHINFIIECIVMCSNQKDADFLEELFIIKQKIISLSENDISNIKNSENNLKSCKDLCEKYNI
jgi:hypothetical protein